MSNTPRHWRPAPPPRSTPNKKWPARCRAGHSNPYELQFAKPPALPLRRSLVSGAFAAALLRRDILGVHFGFVPVKHEVGIGIVAHQSAAEAHAVIFLQARCFRLSHHFHVEV